ncbi:hypothetical protein CV770_13400 [Bradyrhizobium sp. AC87j1]|nr:hypothetical protein CV770_13400 [Bradyrhizobium sp. AC87j1]
MKAEELRIGVKQDRDPQRGHQHDITMQDRHRLPPIAVGVLRREQEVVEAVRRPERPKASGRDRDEAVGVLNQEVDIRIRRGHSYGLSLGANLGAKGAGSVSSDVFQRLLGSERDAPNLRKNKTS